MPQHQQATTPSSPGTNAVSFRLLAGLIISFLLGFAAHALAQNISPTNALTFSTPELITFVLSVLLSGASIFLAVAAIYLGKFSEQAMIQRSDESIRIQNEVFQKTTDALQRIESSTGVTEKRIEDIISGRVGDISQKVAQIATEAQDTQGGLKAQDIEDIVKRSLYQSFREEGIIGSRLRSDPQRTAELESERLRTVRKLEYEKQHSSMLAVLSARPDLKATKLGQGNVSGVGDDAYDGIFLRTDNKKIAVSDFAPHHRAESVRKVIIGSLTELQKSNYAHVYIILYGPNNPLEQTFAEATAVAVPELKHKLTLIRCNPETLENDLASFPIELD